MAEAEAVHRHLKGQAAMAEREARLARQRQYARDLEQQARERQERKEKEAALRDVADRVGIRIPSLYNHFASKDRLYAAVLERGIGPVLRTLAASAVDDQQSRSRILEDTLAALAERPNLPRLVLHETLAGGRHLRKMLEEWLGPVLRQAQQLVESGPAAERWKPEQLPHLVLAMYNIVVGYFAAAPIYRDLDGTDLLGADLSGALWVDGVIRCAENSIRLYR